MFFAIPRGGGDRPPMGGATDKNMHGAHEQNRRGAHDHFVSARVKTWGFDDNQGF